MPPADLVGIWTGSAVSSSGRVFGRILKMNADYTWSVDSIDLNDTINEHFGVYALSNDTIKFTDNGGAHYCGASIREGKYHYAIEVGAILTLAVIEDTCAKRAAALSSGWLKQ
jgi:hypothetical protein